jgi:hypothetical protein
VVAVSVEVVVAAATDAVEVGVAGDFVVAVADGFVVAVGGDVVVEVDDGFVVAALDPPEESDPPEGEAPDDVTVSEAEA